MIEAEKKDYLKESCDELMAAKELFLKVFPRTAAGQDSIDDAMRCILQLYEIIEKLAAYNMWYINTRTSDAQSHCDFIGRKLLDDEWRLNAHQWKDRRHVNEHPNPFPFPEPCCDIKKEQNEQSTP